jgi:hypothetical protein
MIKIKNILESEIRLIILKISPRKLKKGGVPIFITQMIAQLL